MKKITHWPVGHMIQHVPLTSSSFKDVPDRGGSCSCHGTTLRCRGGRSRYNFFYFDPFRKPFSQIDP
jgi:hypothetical protein